MEAAVADGLLHQRFLAKPALEVLVGRLLQRGERFGVRDEFVGFAFEEGKGVGAAHAEDAIHEAVEVLLAAERQMSFDDHAIKAGQDGDNGPK